MEPESGSTDPCSHEDPSKDEQEPTGNNHLCFEVHLNTSLVEEELCGSKTFAEFTEEFASWEPSAETSREFKPQGIQQLLKKIEDEDSCFKVIGFNEFPYTKGNKLHGKDREVEREYWLRLKGIGKQIGGNDNLVILHVHYQGKWNEIPKRRDRSVIKQVNIRHTTTIKANAFHMKCADLNKWREKYGTSVLKEIPTSGWKWREDASLCPAVHKVLIRAEKCTRMVRSLDFNAIKISNYYVHRAMIIPVQKYEAGIPYLANVMQDGAKLQSALQQLGWEVSFEPNLTFVEAQNTIGEFAELVKDNGGACLFAWIGHGIELHGKQFFVPRDAALGEHVYSNHGDFVQSVQGSCIGFDFVRQCLFNVRDGSEPTIFVLDCCRNDFWSSCSLGVSKDREFSVNSREIENSIVVFSTTAGSTAEDGPVGMGGPFMGAFTEEILKEGQDLDEALNNTRRRVRELSSNCQLAPSTSLLYGKFYFNLRSHHDVSPAVKCETIVSSSVQEATSDGGLSRIAKADAREFWREYFHTDVEVSWACLRAALCSEFRDLSDAALTCIKAQIDLDDDGIIQALEFNIFTKRLGLTSQIASIIHEFSSTPGEEPIQSDDQQVWMNSEPAADASIIHEFSSAPGEEPMPSRHTGTEDIQSDDQQVRTNSEPAADLCNEPLTGREPTFMTTPMPSSLEVMSVSELKSLALEKSVDLGECLEKAEILEIFAKSFSSLSTEENNAESSTLSGPQSLAEPPQSFGITNPLASEQTEEAESLRAVLEMPRSSVTYIGTGSVLGGRKLRYGFLVLNGCWLIIVRERGDAKEPFNVGQCQFLRSDKMAQGRSLEIIPDVGKNAVVALETVSEREQWLKTLAICRRLLDEATKLGNGALSRNSRFEEITDFLIPMGKLQLVCTGGGIVNLRGDRDVAHAVARMPLSIHSPHFEALVRALPRNAYFSIGVKLDKVARTRRVTVGRAENELGMSSDGELKTGPNEKSRNICEKLVSGDRVGCGICSDASEKRCIYFSINGSVVATVPCPKDAIPRPVIAVEGKGACLEVALGLSTLPDVKSFSGRCRLNAQGGKLMLVCSELDDALNKANENDIISLAAGVYVLDETIVINRKVTIRALEPGKVKIIKEYGGIAFRCKAQGVVLEGLRVRSYGGNSNAGISEPGSAVCILVSSGACRLEACDVQCSCGTGVAVTNGHLQCAAGSKIGPCGRNGILLYSQATAELNGTVIKDCLLWCFCVHGGCSAKLESCKLLHGNEGGLICSSETNPAPATCSVTGSTIMGNTDQPKGEGIVLNGPSCSASAISCTIAGFRVVAKASCRDAKLTLRACKLAQSTYCFMALQNSVVVHVDCTVLEMKNMKIESQGGRVVDL